MKFALAGQQFRHFRSGLQCLGKIGSEPLIEALPERLVLRSINSSRSAFVSVTYYEDFFDAYDMGASAIVQAGILMKQMAAIFRTQRAQRTIFDLEENATHLVATVVCENGLQKVYKVPTTDSEILQATVDKDGLSITVVGHADEFNRLLSSFQSSLSEVTIIAMPDSGPGGSSTKDVKIRSYVDPAKGFSDKSLHTNLDINAMEVFTEYDNRSGALADVTFNLKDFRAMLHLCEAQKAGVALRFEQAGSPLVVGPHLQQGDGPEMRYHAELVLATLLESQCASMTNEVAGRPAARAGVVPGSGRIRTPSNAGDTPWQAGDGRTPPTGAEAGAATANGRQAGGNQTSGAGRSRFAPPDTARRDLGDIMQQAAPGRLGSGNGVSPHPGMHQNGHANARHGSGSGAPAGGHMPAGQAVPRNSSRQQQQHQQHQQQPLHQHVRPPDRYGASGSLAAGGAAAAAADDEGLDNFASLPPDEEHFQSQRQAVESESVSARHGSGANAVGGHGAPGADAMQHEFGLEYDDDDADGAGDAVPGTPLK